MKTTQNRIQTYWPEVKKLIQREWPLLTEVDLEEIDGEYDRLIRKVKELYNGPIEIMQEAPIRGKLQRFLNDLENP